MNVCWRNQKVTTRGALYVVALAKEERMRKESHGYELLKVITFPRGTRIVADTDKVDSLLNEEDFRIPLRGVQFNMNFEKAHSKTVTL